jgi:uncharacterized membrane protein
MEISNSETFLIVWAVTMTVLYFFKRNQYQEFIGLTIYKLKRVVDGTSKIVITEDHVEIIDIKE